MHFCVDPELACEVCVCACLLWKLEYMAINYASLFSAFSFALVKKPAEFVESQVPAGYLHRE